MNEKTFDTEFNQAENSLNKGCFDKAIREFQVIIQKFPSEAKCYSKLGVCFACQKKFKQAKEYMEKAIELKSEFPEPYNNLGNIFLEEREYEKAVEFYKKAINLNPDYAAPYSNLGIAYKKLNLYSEAVKSFKKAAEIDRKFPTVKVKEIMKVSKAKISINWIILIIVGIVFIWFLSSR